MRKFLLAVFCIPLVFADCLAAQPAEDEFKSISIMASSSLTTAMTEILENYSEEKGLTVSAIYDSPAELERRIKEGERADIFIAENPRWINDLKQMGLIDVYSISQIAGNYLVVVSSIGRGQQFSPQESIHDLLAGLTRQLFVMADDADDPLGVYSKMALEKLGLYAAATPMMIRADNSTTTVYEIAKENNAGIVYYSDAYKNPELKISAVIPTELYEPVIYDSGVVAGENMAPAREFLEYLKTPESQKVLEKHGFIIFKNS